ncbi:MAG TPA: biosynthetic arginine decarboxylase, partial [Longimicrobiales bacterium]
MTEEGEATGWGPERSAELYRIAQWGKGYFDVSSQGTVLVRPRKDGAGQAIDLLEVVEALRERELSPPVLLRFPGITRHRMEEIKIAFARAIQEVEYGGTYTCVYPIKVNQARHVCEEVRDIGARLGFGLEVGTKPELLAALALTDGHDDMPIVCNGFKDEEYLETVVRAARLGRRILPVVEQLFELPILMRLIREHDPELSIGLRIKLTSQGSGRWSESAGHRGKFGLTAAEAMSAVERLRGADLLDRLTLLHCHIGSQVSDIRRLKNAVSELAHVYGELVRLGAPLTTLDLGGGLGVDYDGTNTPTDNSVNYDIQEYALDLVYRIAGSCDQAGVAHPDLITESGRAITAYSSVLVCEVVGRRVYDPLPDMGAIRSSVQEREDEAPQPLLDLLDAVERIETDDPVALYHDSAHAQEEASSLFRLGYISIEDQTAAEAVTGFVWRRVLERAGWPPPVELENLADSM